MVKSRGQTRILLRLACLLCVLKLSSDSREKQRIKKVQEVWRVRYFWEFYRPLWTVCKWIQFLLSQVKKESFHTDKEHDSDHNK